MSENPVKSPLNRYSTRGEIAGYINNALETGDIVKICRAIGVVARLHNVSEIAARSGMQRESIYRAFAGGDRHPNFDTVLKVLDAMGLQLKVHLGRGRRAKPARLSKSSDASRESN